MAARRQSTSKRSFKEKFQASLTDSAWDKAIIKATDSDRKTPKLKHVQGTNAVPTLRTLFINGLLGLSAPAADVPSTSATKRAS